LHPQSISGRGLRRSNDKRWEQKRSTLENYVAEQEKVVAHWKTCFSQLVGLANGAVDGVP